MTSALDYTDSAREGREMSEWQQIETAPKDGTEIILRRGNRVTAGSFDVQPETERNDYFEWWYSNDGGFTESEPPTHWMPLPEPPEES